MTELISHSAVQDLADLHWLLDKHFRQLHQERKLLSASVPVFALEHGLGDADLAGLQRAVRSAVWQGLGPGFRKWWLPFVVYAAESGYGYAGGESWHTFEESTPGWGMCDRNRVRGWFEKFADGYGGIRPQGAFASKFPIVAWPTTHAVLPVYLQRNLARLLFEFRAGLTTELLQDPGALGARLAARAVTYTERFRYFCESTALLGHVSAALLSGEDDESPYLLQSTLRRLVAGLSSERESRDWLEAARRSARRARARGLVPVSRPAHRPERQERLPSSADPRLTLKRADGGWRAYAELPDFGPVLARLPHLAGELRTRRARIAGAERPFLPRQQLLYPGHKERLARWPRPGEPFIRLERGTDAANQVIADQCVVTPGPSWLFRCKAPGLAVEVKGKTVRPGCSYVLVADAMASLSRVPWAAEAAIEAEGVRAFEITVPDPVSDSGAAALAAAGIAVASHVAIRPAGIVASNWDGEGTAEWLAGEPCMIAIRADQAPEACAVTLDGDGGTVSWPAGQRELLLRLEDLNAGTHPVSVAVLAAGGRVIADGTLLVTIRDPLARPDGGAPGEGIRMLSDPAKPTLSELWDGRAEISVDGPVAGHACLTVTLLSDHGEHLAEIQKAINLPLPPDAWSRVVASIRKDARFQNAYDSAESATLTVERAGTGFASLTCDRGFQPLRWRVASLHDRGHVARLIDRTDGARTTTELFRVDEPLVPVLIPPAGDIPLPPRGGLLRATAGEATAIIVAPTRPNEVLQLGIARPRVVARSRTPSEIERLATAWHWWDAAERPADPFAGYEVSAVLTAITGAIASLVGGGRWGAIERHARDGRNLARYVGEMERLVGDSVLERALAQAVARHLWEWASEDQLLCGYPALAAEAGTPRPSPADTDTARFALALASRPGLIATDWEPAQRDDLLSRILARPALFRAARFAVLGARAFHDPEDTAYPEGGAR